MYPQSSITALTCFGKLSSPATNVPWRHPCSCQTAIPWASLLPVKKCVAASQTVTPIQIQPKLMYCHQIHHGHDSHNRQGNNTLKPTNMWAKLLMVIPVPLITMTDNQTLFIIMRQPAAQAADYPSCHMPGFNMPLTFNPVDMTVI